MSGLNSHKLAEVGWKGRWDIKIRDWRHHVCSDRTLNEAKGTTIVGWFLKREERWGTAEGPQAKGTTTTTTIKLGKFWAKLFKYHYPTASIQWGKQGAFRKIVGREEGWVALACQGFGGFWGVYYGCGDDLELRTGERGNEWNVNVGEGWRFLTFMTQASPWFRFIVYNVFCFDLGARLECFLFVEI